MQKLYHTFLLLIVFVTFTNCRKDPSFIGEPDPTPVVITPDPISTSVKGLVVDEHDLPAAGVSVTAGNKSTITDSKGHFRIDNVVLDKVNTLVTAGKAGYFKGMRLFAATNGTNHVKIKLIKKELAGTVNAGEGGTVTLSNGAKIQLPAHGVVLAAGNSNYEATVNVFATYIDPSAADIGSTVPGSFAGYDKNAKKMILTSYGMLAVELESSAGEKLQVKEGYNATLTVPVPAAAQPVAPVSIPLWYVDEQTGLWREEGTATKQGTNYTGTVKHFSFWNCDFGNNAITLSMTVKNSQGLPLVNTPVRISRPGAGWLTTATGYTDSLGQAAGIVPSGEALVAEVMDECGNTVFRQDIPAVAQNTDIGILTVTASTAAVVTIHGRLLDCSNQPVTDGYVIVTLNDMARSVNVNASGEYELSFVTCPGTSTAGIVAVDNGNGMQQSSTALINLTTPVTEVADIVTCGESPFDYINYNIDGVNYYWTQMNSFQMFSTYSAINGPGYEYLGIQADDQPGSRLFYFVVTGLRGVGTAINDGSNASVTFTSTDAFASGGMVSYEPGFTANITRFPDSPDDYLEGSFSGQYRHSSTGNTLHAINGVFRVKRRN